MNKYKSGRGRNRSEKPLVSLSPFTARLLSKAVPEHDWLNAQPILYPHQMDTEEDGIPEGPWLGFDLAEDKSRAGTYFLDFVEREETDYASIERRILDHYEANPLRNPALENAARHVQRALASSGAGRLLEQFREMARQFPPVTFRSSAQRHAPNIEVQLAVAADAIQRMSAAERAILLAEQYGVGSQRLEVLRVRRGGGQYQFDTEAYELGTADDYRDDTLPLPADKAWAYWILINNHSKIRQDRELLVTAAKDLGYPVDANYVLTTSESAREQVLKTYELRRKNLGAGLPEPTRKVRRTVGGLPVIDEIDGAGRIVRKAGKCN